VGRKSLAIQRTRPIRRPPLCLRPDPRTTGDSQAEDHARARSRAERKAGRQCRVQAAATTSCCEPPQLTHAHGATHLLLMQTC
jgi:hypothetical protein